MRKIIVIATILTILVIVNISINQREKLLTHGEIVLLELVPVYTRSLMQGVYMALRFQIAMDAFRKADYLSEFEDGYIVANLDKHKVAKFKRLAKGMEVSEGETLLRYRIRNQKPKFATNAFFFQEGKADHYAGARYGEFRVSPNGDMILTGLRGVDFQQL